LADADIKTVLALSKSSYCFRS